MGVGFAGGFARGCLYSYGFGMFCWRGCCCLVWVVPFMGVFFGNWLVLVTVECIGSSLWSFGVRLGLMTLIV